MKPTIAFVTGGYSGESVISYASAITIQHNLDYDRFTVYRIDVTPEGWFHPMADGTRISCLSETLAFRRNDASFGRDSNTSPVTLLKV